MSSAKPLQTRQTRSRLTIRIPSSIAEQVKRETQRRDALRHRNDNRKNVMLATPSLSSWGSTLSRSSCSDSGTVPIKRIHLRVTPPSETLSTVDGGRKRKHESSRKDLADVEGDDVMTDEVNEADEEEDDCEPADKKIRVAIARHKYGYSSVTSMASATSYPEDPAAFPTPSPSYPSYSLLTASTASTVSVETIEGTSELLSSSQYPSSSLPSSSQPQAHEYPSFSQPRTPEYPSSSQPRTPEYRPSSPTRPRVSNSIRDLLSKLLPSAQDRVTHVITPLHFSVHQNALLALLTQCPETLADIPAHAKPGRYELMTFLGAGAAGLVMKALDHYTSKEVAIKLIVDNSNGRSDTHAKWHREVSLLSSLDGAPGILQVTDIFCHPACTVPSLNDGGDDNEENIVGAIYAIVTPFYPDCLCDVEERFRHLSRDYRKWLEITPQQPWPKTKSLPALPLPWTHAIFRQLATALAGMHARGIYHGDIKDENALVSVGGRPAIPGDEEEDETEPPVNPATIDAVFCDLGHARFLPNAAPAGQHPIHQRCSLTTCSFRNTASKTSSDLAARESLSQYGTPAMTPPEMYPNIALAQSWCDYEIATRQGLPAKSPEGRATCHNPLPADVWALGLMLYTMVYGSLPYHVTQVFDYPRSKPEVGGPFTPTGKARCHIPVPSKNAKGEALPRELKDLLRGMLTTKARDRWSMAAVLENGWVKKASV